MTENVPVAATRGWTLRAYSRNNYDFARATRRNRRTIAMTAPGTESASGLTPSPVREVALARPFRWLYLGWRDFTHAIVPSALHGMIAAFGGLAILAFAWGHFYLLAGAFSGFLLIAPVLATGLYELSRRLAQGEPPRMRVIFDAWRCSCKCLLGFGLLLAVVGTFWVGISSVLIALFVQSPITGLESFIRYVVLSQDSHLFEIWTALGGLLAALVFAASVVAMPLMLDRDADLITAVLTSIQAVAANPVAMALWATIIMALTALAMGTLFLGLIIVIPVLGHATWHAYIDLVDPSSTIPPRRR